MLFYFDVIEQWNQAIIKIKARKANAVLSCLLIYRIAPGKFFTENI